MDSGSKPSHASGVFLAPEMSVHVSSVVWQMEFSSPGMKLVALAMADMANDELECWPSIKSLVRRTNLGEKYVRQHVRTLCDDGVFFCEQRIRENGSHSSNLYRFIPPSLKRGVLPEMTSTPTSQNREGGTPPFDYPQNHNRNHQLESSPLRGDSEILHGNELRLKRWFKRRESTPLSDKEKKSIKSTLQTSDDEWTMLEAYYANPFPPNNDPRRRDMATLLNNWQGEIDRARGFMARNNIAIDGSNLIEADPNPDQPEECKTWTLQAELRQALNMPEVVA